MNREEILAKSKQENRGQDVANLEISMYSIQFGWIVAICLLAVVAVLDAILFKRMDNGIFFAVMASSSSVFFVKYLKLRKRHELVIAIVYAVAAIAFLIAWIMQLTK